MTTSRHTPSSCACFSYTPTSRKPSRQSRARLAVFSTNTRDTNFQKPAFSASCKSPSRDNRPLIGFEDDDGVDAVKPLLDLLRYTKTGLKGGHTIFNTLIVDCYNGDRIGWSRYSQVHRSTPCHNHPFCSASHAASIRFCAPSFCMAAER